MLYFDRTNVSKWIDVNKISKSKEIDNYHYWYFLNKEFKFQSYLYNRYHGFVMMFMNLSNRAILIVKGAEYCCIISGISKSDAINLMQNVGLTEKRGTL